MTTAKPILTKRCRRVPLGAWPKCQGMVLDAGPTDPPADHGLRWEFTRTPSRSGDHHAPEPVSVFGPATWHSFALPISKIGTLRVAGKGCYQVWLRSPIGRRRRNPRLRRVPPAGTRQRAPLRPKYRAFTTIHTWRRCVLGGEARHEARHHNAGCPASHGHLSPAVMNETLAATLTYARGAHRACS
jgi:hypothetical protein